MTILARLIRIALVTALCIIVFSAVFEFLNVVPHYLFPPDYIQDVARYRKSTPLFGAFLWGVVFRAPGYLFLGSVPLLLIFAVLELLSVKNRWIYLGVWAGAALLAVGARFLSSELVAALLSAAIVGYIYWLLAGRTAGDWIHAWRARERGSGRGFMTYASYAVLAYLAYQLAGYLHYCGKLLWVSSISEPGLGSPPFHVMGRRGLTGAHKVALMDFPDPHSCLENAMEELSPENLKRMDWDRIDNEAEAEVCMFRLLGSYEDMSSATDWFEAQGFRVPDGFSSARPYADRDGTLRVSGSYSIRKNGPKFPTRGFVRRLFHSIPYGMNADATWSSNGKQLLGVRITFNTL
ncbi:hypothetical protein CYK37_27200 [Mesorhizobium loti]|nr:hypothetical protein [Mesorhizobium loti]PLP56228.1 hypothetical protein CYK37_27200 [Mesorhizobium loti]